MGVVGAELSRDLQHVVSLERNIATNYLLLSTDSHSGQLQEQQPGVEVEALPGRHQAPISEGKISGSEKYHKVTEWRGKRP